MVKYLDVKIVKSFEEDNSNDDNVLGTGPDPDLRGTAVTLHHKYQYIYPRNGRYIKRGSQSGHGPKKRNDRLW